MPGTKGLTILDDSTAPALNQEFTYMKKTRKRMTIEEHRKIGAWINDPTLRLISCNVANNYGKTSQSAKYARKLADLIIQLKSSMESDAYADGHQTEATAIYYPCTTDYSKLSQ
jgi:hypothetical protein